MPSEAIVALRKAVAAFPSDSALRLHLAELELGEGLLDAAVATLGQLLAVEPTNERARELLVSAVSGSSGATESSGESQASATTSPGLNDAEDPSVASAAETKNANFDWDAAEEDLGSDLKPAFVDPSGSDDAPRFAAERPGVTLDDVGGLNKVKERLSASFLAPLKHPELRQLYGKSLRGGLLLYGPPGCGKTFLARAVAGELGAGFISIGVADVLDMWLGSSEQNIHELFQQARRSAPCVVFLDELDTLGQRRTSAASIMVGVVNQLLTEMDGFADDNDGVFALAATNQPWQVDPALRRPGRFDRTLLVLPPDGPAREAIFRHHLKHRPVEGVDLRKLSAKTDGFSGADIALACEAATELALLDSARTGEPRMVGMEDLNEAVAGLRPSIGPWLETARNFVQFGEDDGTMAELRAYLKRVRRL